MAVKDNFIAFLNELMAAAPEVTANMSPEVKAYIDCLIEPEAEKPILTDNGKVLLKYMQDNPSPTYRAKDIAEGLDISARKVSGSLRKLVTDGFVEKLSKDPIIYAITEKGKNFEII